MGCKSCQKKVTPAEMLDNLRVTFRNALRHAVRTGEIKAGMDVAKQRIALCSRCEFKEGKRCTQCGCFIVAKAGLKVSTCPKGYW